MSADYNLFVINMVLVLLISVSPDKKLPHGDSSFMATMCLIGACIGQLAFGYIGDKLGRKKSMILTMFITIIGSIGCACSKRIGSVSLYHTIAYWRLVLGIGVGGVYPISATMSSESAKNGHGSGSTAIVFSMQGIANILSPLLCLFLIFMMKNDYNVVWRLSFAMGSIISGIGFILAMFTKETVRLNNNENNNDNNNNPISFINALKQKKYWKKLIASAGCWFLMDFTMYANILFGPVVIDKIIKANNPVSTAEQYLLVAAIGLPGYFLSAFLMDKIGSRNIQLMGFMMMCIIYCLLGFCLDIFTKYTAIMLILYGLSFLFTNFGPNATTFLLSTELYPREVRSTFNGISAATGKFGATLAGLFFKPITDHVGINIAFFLCSFISFIGFIITYFFVHHPRYSPKPIFQISNEVVEIESKKVVGKLDIEMVSSDSTPFLSIF